MPQRSTTLMSPPIEALLDGVDSKFTLVTLAARRARQINSYYNQLGEGMGAVAPPQVTSVSGKPLTIAFEEIAAHKAVFRRVDPADQAAAEAAGAAGSLPPAASLPVDDSLSTDESATGLLDDATAPGDLPGA